MRYTRGLPFIVTVILIASGCASTPKGPLAAEGVCNYEKVTWNLRRGAQPTPDGVKELANQGVVTIINLRPEAENPTAIGREKVAAEKLMKHYEPVPLSNWCAPREEDIEHILSLINNPAEQPVFVHCQRGADRTGTVIAVYRISHDCWNAEDAIREARSHGMGWWQFPMRHFIRRWYRARQPKPCVATPS